MRSFEGASESVGVKQAARSSERFRSVLTASAEKDVFASICMRTEKTSEQVCMTILDSSCELFSISKTLSVIENELQEEK